jgi:predicted metalloendopeptidase
MMKVVNWRNNYFIHLVGKRRIELPLIDWNQMPPKLVGTQAYVVNAAYTPSKNNIFVNLGYMQKPFVDLSQSLEYNLARVGFTVGHEMSHCLDDWGSQYDADGNLNDWWTPEDRRKYKAIQDDVIKQYEVFAARDGIYFDAAISIGEDLADIQSLSVCSEYLRDFQEKNEDLVPIRYLGFEAFFTYFAYQQKQFVGKKALSAQLKTNPHPLDKYRCNVPLSRSEIFRALYNVKRGDGMWWHNTNTVW